MSIWDLIGAVALLLVIITEIALAEYYKSEVLLWRPNDRRVEQ